MNAKFLKIFQYLNPFIVVDIIDNTNKNPRYRLYHQSLVEFLKQEHLEDGSLNVFFIFEPDAHRKIVERYYDNSKDCLKITLLKEYELRYLPEHLFSLINCDAYEEVDWYRKLLQLAKNKEFEQKQHEYFPFDTDLPLKTIKRAFEASLEKEEPVRTAELILLHSAKVIRIVKQSPLSDLDDIYIDSSNLGNNDTFRETWRIANHYNEEARVMWYLLIAWYLDCKKYIPEAQKTLDNLFKKDLVYINNNHIINQLVYFLYPCYKDTIVKIFDYLSNDNICNICLLFIKNKNDLEVGLEVFRYINDNANDINANTNLELYQSDIDSSLISQIIDKSNLLHFRIRCSLLHTLKLSLNLTK